MCDGDVCFPANTRTDGINAAGDGGVIEGRGGKAELDLLAVPPGAASDELVSNHFWPRITATLAGLSLLLTLVSMRLVVPAGMRWRLRRRGHPAQPTDGSPIIEEPAP